MDEEPGVAVTLEDETSTENSPSAPKKKKSLLVNLQRQSCTDTEGTAEPKTPYARTEEEMERFCKAQSLPLTEDPLN